MRLRHARKTRIATNRISERGSGGCARERIAKGATFDDSQGTWTETPPTRISALSPKRHHRSGCRRRRLRAQAWRSERASHRTLRHRASASRKDRAGHEKSYEEVATQIKHEIAESRARTKSANCATRSKTSARRDPRWPNPPRNFGLKVRTIEAVDRAGRGPDGKPVAGLPANSELISRRLHTDIGVDTEALQLPSGGYLYYDVTGVTPSHERPLDEVKEQVVARWRDDEIAKRLQPRPTRWSANSRPAPRFPTSRETQA